MLRLRFGLEDGRTRSLDEVAEIFNVTREKIRKLEFRTLMKLRYPSHRTKKR